MASTIVDLTTGLALPLEAGVEVILLLLFSVTCLPGDLEPCLTLSALASSPLGLLSDLLGLAGADFTLACLAGVTGLAGVVAFDGVLYSGESFEVALLRFGAGSLQY